MSKRSVFLLAISVALTNFWIWRILKADLLLGLSLILISLLLYFANLISSKKVFLSILVLSVFVAAKSLIAGFDYNLKILTPDQQKQLNERHGYFSRELGKLFQNRFTLRFYKDVYPYLRVYQGNVFKVLSPNLYFFSSHPREREKVQEMVMYPSILMIPFLVGFLVVLKTTPKIIIFYVLFASLTSGFIRQNYLLGPVLFYPLINLLITNGLIKIYQLFKHEH